MENLFFFFLTQRGLLKEKNYIAKWQVTHLKVTPQKRNFYADNFFLQLPETLWNSASIFLNN